MKALNTNAVGNRSFVFSMLRFSVASWVNFIVSIVSTIITTRIFPPEIFGTLNIFNSASNLLMGLFCLGLDSGLLRFYYELETEDDKKNLFIKSVIVPVVLLGASAIFGVFILSDTISSSIFGKESTLLVILLFIKTTSILILRFFNIWYRLTSNIKMYTLQNILVHIFSKLFVILSIVVHVSTESVLVFNVLGVSILLVIYVFYQGKEIIPLKIDLSFRGFSKIFKFTVFAWPISFVVYLNTFASQLIVKEVLGDYMLGIFTSVNLFLGILGVFQTGFMTYWATFIYKHYKTENEKIKQVHNYMLLVTFFIMVAIIIFQKFIYLFIGNEYRGSRIFFSLMMVFPLFRLISETTSYGISIEKKSFYTLIIYVLSVIINLALSLVLVKIIGIAGAAIASSISAIVFLVLITVIGQKYYKTISNLKKTISAPISLFVISLTNYIFFDIKIVITVIVSIVSIMMGLLFKQEIMNVFFFAVKVIKTSKIAFRR